MVTAIVVGVAVVLWIVSLELVFRFGQNRGRKQIADKLVSLVGDMIADLNERMEEDEKPQAKRKTPKRDKHGHFIKITKGKK